MEAKEFDTAQAEPARFTVTQDEKNTAVLVHLAALAGLVVPFGNVLGPLVVWLLKRDNMPFVDHQGKEAINFQITMSIAMVISLVMIVIIVGILTSIGLGIFWLVIVIKAAMRTSEGMVYRYPFSIRFVK